MFANRKTITEAYKKGDQRTEARRTIIGKGEEGKRENGEGSRLNKSLKKKNKVVSFGTREDGGGGRPRKKEKGEKVG